MDIFRVFFYKIWANVTATYKGKNLLWQIGAIILTYLLVTTGFDWLYYLSTRSELLQIILFPAVILGGLFPLYLPILLYVWGKVRNSRRTALAAGAMGQAAMLGYIISTFYKSLTGRIPPPFREAVISTVDTSHGFQLGFLKGGIFWGWPSSHTTVAFAMAAALIAMYPESKWLKILAIVYALYVGIAVSATIHWFSEFAAGAIVGTVIGLSVGKSFRSKLSSI